VSTVDKEPHNHAQTFVNASHACASDCNRFASGRSGSVGDKDRYTPDGPFPPEFYEGVINTIGLDIGFTSGGVMTWSVVAPTVGPPRGALAGLYVGASGDVTAGGAKREIG
jgi:hypothetical protein